MEDQTILMGYAHHSEAHKILRGYVRPENPKGLWSYGRPENSDGVWNTRNF